MHRNVGRKPYVSCFYFTLAIWLSFGALQPRAEAMDGPAPTWVSSKGSFHVTYTSQLDPIVINRMHSWVLHIEDADGIAVTGARLSLSGGMPVHDHGLPTRPRVTRELGQGDYLIEGLRFHMNGEWKIEVEIEAGDVGDVVIIALEL